MDDRTIRTIALLIALAIILVAARMVIGWAKTVWRDVTIFQFQAGLLYRDGSLEKALGPGRHRINTWHQTIELVDLRERLYTVGGQEVLSADNLAVKITATLRVRIADPALSHQTSQNAGELIYAAAQSAIRRAAAKRPLDQLLAERGEIGKEIEADLAPVLKDIGHALVQADVRDCMLTSDAKKAFADLFRAKKEGEAALERARGETAALRNLANAGRMLKDNPALVQLRMIQVVQASAQKGATVILNAAPGIAPITTPSSSDANPTSSDAG